MSFDAWKESAPEDDGPGHETECPICTGHEDAEPCSEDCDRLVKEVRTARKIRGLYVAAKRAMKLAKAYRDEAAMPYTDRPKYIINARLDDVLQQVDCYRDEISRLRSGEWAS